MSHYIICFIVDQEPQWAEHGQQWARHVQEEGAYHMQNLFHCFCGPRVHLPQLKAAVCATNVRYEDNILAPLLDKCTKKM